MKRLLQLLQETSIRWKLLVAFVIIVGCVVGIAVAAVTLQLREARRAASLEAEHVANAIASSSNQRLLDNPRQLQPYIENLGKVYDRDIFIVDRHGRVVASTNPRAVGTHYENGDLEMTMLDGQSRSFVGADTSAPGEVNQVAVPLRADALTAGSPVVGAVVFEYTLFYNTLMAEAKHAALITAAMALSMVVLGWSLGLSLIHAIVKPLQALQHGVAQIAAGNYPARVEVHAGDEFGRLAVAFNGMAEDLGRSHAALQERADELAQANARLQEEMDKQREAAERIEYLAYHDNLTALPNRAMFGVALAQARAQAQRYGRKFALFFVDLDRFKQINDTLGHDTGDQLLQEVAARLKRQLRDSDVVARLGGDEFVVLVPELTSDDQATTVARKILAAIATPFAIDGQELRVTASIGISVFPKDGADEQTLMKYADVAMYQAKESGRSGFQFYAEAFNANSVERLAMQSSLRGALERDELVLHYQPKKNFRTGAISGMEVLLRWQHPEQGMISPAEFIPVAEETGLIVPIGKWVLRTACLQTMAWRESGLSDLVVAVNLSPRQFADENLLGDITSILMETGMDATLLELEITESMIMRDAQKALRVLNTLKAMGVRIAVDDFGTGYSSLSTLKQFPIDTLKIDRSFIRDLATDAEDRGLTEAIIAMGKTLHLRLVAEGVETRAQADFLRERGCNELQGYYFSRPVPADEFEVFTSAYRLADTQASLAA